MSQGFKLKYDQMRESDPTSPQAKPETPSRAFDEFYENEGHTRNICFVWRDGKRMFLNYGYLIFVEYFPDKNSIVLSFTSHIITLTGVNFEGLFYDLMQHLPKQIICTDPRYNIIDENDKALVNEIQVTKNE